MNFKKAINLLFDTPFMVVDMDQTKKNIIKVQKLANENGKKLRPHSKTHKTPEIAKMQIEAGAIGVCIQKTAEAEVMFFGGIKNLLFSNETFGNKFLRLGRLISMGSNLTIAVDNIPSIKQFSEVCTYLGIEGNILLDVNVGMDRCGIEPNRIDEVIEAIRGKSNLNLLGLMAYDGQVNSPDLKKREDEVKREEFLLEPLIKKVKRYCTDDLVVSVGGTPTVEIWAKSAISTELQPGTYIYYDMHCVKQKLCTRDEISMGVVSTCISEALGNRIVLDAGYKSVAIDQGVYPTVIDEDGHEYQVLSMSEEHTVIKSVDNTLHLGKRFLLLPYHACTTTDLWDKTYIIGGNNQAYSMIISGRGKRE